MLLQLAMIAKLSKPILSYYLFEADPHGIMKMISYHQFLPQQIDAQFIWL